ncbi:unnamed protein product, partial [marine sediment metagenome]
SSTVPVVVWGMQAIEYLKMIDESKVIRLENVKLKRNKLTQIKELNVTKHSRLDLL